ncbi:hypothetical protein, partial [Anaeromyxobacter sp. PSR-1]|uniref:hypothetical protein n=1 Tax=Anaeromyxobacter sp. PSR-1 TaxID=1300915 RepID=UPI00126A12FC
MLPSLEQFFRNIAGDSGLANGAALGVLSQVVDDRGQVQVPFDDDERAAWKRMTPHAYVFVGADANRIVSAANGLIADLWNGSPPPSRLSAWPHLPQVKEGLILVPATCVSIVNGSIELGPLPSQVADRLLAIKNRTQPRIVVRLDAQAAKDWQGVVRDAGQERSIPLLESRLQRWVNVAALLAIARDPARPVVTRELLGAAH